MWDSATSGPHVVDEAFDGWRLCVLDTDGTQRVAECLEPSSSGQGSGEDPAPELLRHRKQIVRQIAERTATVAALALRVAIGIDWQRHYGGCAVMRHVQRQFHAVEAELLTWAERWATGNGWNVIVEQFFPEHRAVGCDPSRLASITHAMPGVRRLSVGPREPVVKVDPTHALEDANPDRLWILIGALSPDGLREASVTGGTDDPQLLRTWRALLRGANGEMHAGARLRGPTGEIATNPNHRHTVGAHRLAASGVTMLAVAGGVRYEFTDIVAD